MSRFNKFSLVAGVATTALGFTMVAPASAAVKAIAAIKAKDIDVRALQDYFPVKGNGSGKAKDAA